MSAQSITLAEHAYKVFAKLSQDAHITKKEAKALVDSCLLDLEESKGGTIDWLDAIAEDTERYIKAARAFLGGNDEKEARSILNTFRKLQKTAIEELYVYFMYEAMADAAMPEYVVG